MFEVMPCRQACLALGPCVRQCAPWPAWAPKPPRGSRPRTSGLHQLLQYLNLHTDPKGLPAAALLHLPCHNNSTKTPALFPCSPSPPPCRSSCGSMPPAWAPASSLSARCCARPRVGCGVWQHGLGTSRGTWSPLACLHALLAVGQRVSACMLLLLMWHPVDCCLQS